MFRRNNGEDIFDQEDRKCLEPHRNRFKTYMLDYIIPDMCAFYISSGYQLNAFYSDTFDSFINDVLSMQFFSTYKLLSMVACYYVLFHHLYYLKLLYEYDHLY